MDKPVIHFTKDELLYLHLMLVKNNDSSESERIMNKIQRKLYSLKEDQNDGKEGK
jgi:hypothetical protein